MGEIKAFSNQWFDHFIQVVNKDKELNWIAAFMTLDFVWIIGEKAFLIKVREGKIRTISAPSWNDSWEFAIEGPEGVWEKFIEKVPPPMYFDLLGIVTKMPNCGLTGNRLAAMQHARALTRMMSLARSIEGDSKED